MSAKRVVHISLGTHVGGMEKLLVEFARFTDPDRYALTFISLQSRGDLAPQIESQRWPVIAMDKTDGLKPSLVLKLAKTLRRIDPDVVHTHNTAAFVYGVAAAKIAGVSRIIHTRHGQRFNSSRRQTMLFRGLSRFVDHVVSVSADGSERTIAEGISQAKISTIRNGVDLERFPFSGDRPPGRLAVVARLSPEKDIASLIRALDVLHRKDMPLRLDVVGDGSERPELESLTASLGLQSHVRFHGSRHDIPNVLSDVSIFVLPSITEGVSLTLLEAMASGLPVVACDVGGNPEVVVDEKTGILVPPSNPQAMANAIANLHEGRDRAIAFGIAGRKRVEQEFCIRRMVSAYQNLYHGEAA